MSGPAGGLVWPLLGPLVAGGVAWLGWVAGGWVVEMSGPSVLDLPLRFAAVVAALSVMDRVQG